jgi:hypothetical protein
MHACNLWFLGWTCSVRKNTLTLAKKNPIKISSQIFDQALFLAPNKILLFYIVTLGIKLHPSKDCPRPNFLVLLHHLFKF